MKNKFYQSLRGFLLLAIVMLGSFSSFAQGRKVTGKVIDADSQGISLGYEYGGWRNER